MRKRWRKPRLHETLAGMLRGKRAADPKACWLIQQTDAKCVNRKVGSLFAKYLFQKLNERNRRMFERHIRSCLACAAAVHDAFELRRGFQRSKP